MEKRIFMLLLAGIISCMALVSCGNGEKDESESDTEVSSVDDENQEEADDSADESEYMAVINAFIDGVNQDDGQLYETAFHTDEQLDKIFELYESHGYTDFVENYYSYIEENITAAKLTLSEEGGCGDNIQYSFEISEAAKASSDELAEYEESYLANRGSYLPETTLEKVYTIVGIMTAAGDSGSYSTDFVFIIAKESDGAWLIHPYSSTVDLM
ncbi:MAG: hypothetical protein LUD57_03990 [Ruminococcus sp.]|nr:hypothetical protein [Ruminococcus sp.]